MRGDVPNAAIRLMAQLPTRTIERSQAPTRLGAISGGNHFHKRAVMVAGARYETVRDARRKLGIGYQRFYSMLDTGEAKYVK